MSGEAPVRAFVALELPAAVREALGAAIDSAKDGAPGKLGWSAPEKAHLTLAFLGGSDPGKLKALEPELGVAAGAVQPFELALGRPGVFPGPKRPAVLWIGVQPSAPLTALQTEVARVVRAHGWSLEERPFSPHLTCARVKWPGPPGALAAAWGRVEVATVRWQVEELALMKSETRPEGARYTQLAGFKLGG